MHLHTPVRRVIVVAVAAFHWRRKNSMFPRRCPETRAFFASTIDRDYGEIYWSPWPNLWPSFEACLEQSPKKLRSPKRIVYRDISGVNNFSIKALTTWVDREKVVGTRSFYRRTCLSHFFIPRGRILDSKWKQRVPTLDHFR